MNHGTNITGLAQLVAFWSTVRHYRVWIFLGTVFFSLAGATYIFLLPDHYKASTTILVDPQKVPEKYVSPTVSSDPGQRLNTITQQVLSSSRLQQIIDDMHLYSELQGKISREELIEAMRKDITITVKQGSSSGLSAFTIEYEGRHRQVVAQVANQLAASFIDWNLKNREQQAQDTSDFLAGQLKDAKQNLEEQEAKVSAFKMRHLGEMPEQQAAKYVAFPWDGSFRIAYSTGPGATDDRTLQTGRRKARPAEPVTDLAKPLHQRSSGSGGRSGPPQARGRSVESSAAGSAGHSGITGQQRGHREVATAGS